MFKACQANKFEDLDQTKSSLVRRGIAFDLKLNGVNLVTRLTSIMQRVNYKILSIHHFD